jgi:hypothetical protein
MRRSSLPTERLPAKLARADVVNTIEAIYVWLTTEPGEPESFCSVVLTTGDLALPLLTSSIRMATGEHRRHAEIIRRETGCRVRLVRFAAREEIEVLP